MGSFFVTELGGDMRTNCRLGSYSLGAHQSFAAHLPAWHRQPPLQSIVPARQSAVHATAAQSGRALAAMQAVAWQHVAATQSASC
jgi:hypothetical protein